MFCNCKQLFILSIFLILSTILNSCSCNALSGYSERLGDCYGDDLHTEHYFTATSELCAQKCDDNHDCKVFVYNSPDQLCWLKSKNCDCPIPRQESIRNFYKGVWSGHCDDFQITSGDCGTNLITEGDPGLRLSVQDCTEKCRLNRDCVGFVYVTVGNQWEARRCYLKSDLCSNSGPVNRKYIYRKTGGFCGIPSIQPLVDERIVGGIESRAHSWPWQVSLQYSGHRRRHFCGGVILSPWHILSAAHCMKGFLNGPGVKMYAGIHNKKHIRGPTVQQRVIHVGDVKMHEYFTPRNNDVMIITLDVPLNITDSVKPVCLPNSGESVPVGSHCFVTGWGAHSESRTRRAASDSDLSNIDTLYQVAVPIISNTLCNHREWYNGRISNKQLCAGYEYGQQDACKGDSGGPMVCYVNKKWVLHGLVSWGSGCGREKRPGVYTRVSSYLNWIQQNNACSIGPYGGSGGIGFTDIGKFGSKITRIDIRSGSLIDGIEVFYGGSGGGYWGSNGGGLHTIYLASNEYIMRIDGKSGSRVDSIKFTTNIRSYGPYGGGGGHDFSASGNKLVYISGRFGQELDAIKFHFESC